MVLNGLASNETMDVVVADLPCRRVYSTRMQSDFNVNLGAFIVPNGRMFKGAYMVKVVGKSCLENDGELIYLAHESSKGVQVCSFTTAPGPLLMIWED